MHIYLTIIVNIKTGTFIIGSLGIIMGSILLAPMSVFLEYHSFYVTQFVTSGRDSGKLMDDDQVRPWPLYLSSDRVWWYQVPKMEFFSKMLFTILLSLDVLYILACVLLLVGVAAIKHMMMMPWLIWVN